MTRLLRSAFSDPIASGVNTFRALSDVFQQQESQKMQRELMERETAESKLRMEHTRKGMEWKDEQRKWMRETKLKEDQLMGLAGAQAKFRAGIDLDDDDLNHVIRATRAMHLWSDLPVDQWQTLHKNLDVLRGGVEKYWPIINKQMEEGKGAYFTDEQAPDLFNALNKVYGSQINRGKDRHGETEGVEKRINRLYFDPRNGTMTPLLSVKDSKGDTYFAPMTVDRGNDPNAPVLQMPYQMFGAHLNSHIDMSKMIDAAMIKLGDKETKKRVETEAQTLKENEVWLAGSEAMDELIKTKPNASKNELANAYAIAVRKKSKETGIPISEKEITTEIAKISDRPTSYWKEKELDIKERGVVAKEKEIEQKGEQFKETKKLKGRELDIKAEDVKEKRLERKGKEEEKKARGGITPFQEYQKGEKQDTKLEKLMIDVYGETESGSNRPKTVRGVFEEVKDKPKKKAVMETVWDLAKQYRGKGMKADDAFEKAKTETEAAAKKRGLTIEGEEKEAK